MFTSNRKGHPVVWLAAAVFWTLILPRPAMAQNGKPELARAGQLFQSGQFDEAARLYGVIVSQEPSSYEAILGLARISLLRNALGEAETWLQKALALKPGEQEPQALMGELLYRRNAYFQAAPYFEALGRTAKAEKLRAFEGKTPFEIESGPESCSLPFVQTDPLPIIKVTVNGVEGSFLIDTGGWELHVMPEFAGKCGLKPLAGQETGVYAGGRRAVTANAVADRVLLGEFLLRQVPAVIPERSRSPFPVDGIVGTVVLYHFIFTLDYPNGQLILRRNLPELSRATRAAADAAGASSMPFWLAGDHFMFARGTVNGAGPYLFLVDTGMAGGGFSCPEYVIKEANIQLPEEGFQGMGGGGPVTVYPFSAGLTLGPVRREQVRGLYGALPPGLDDRHGFRTGGIISHGFFRSFAVTFDFLSMTLTLQPAA